MINWLNRDDELEEATNNDCFIPLQKLRARFAPKICSSPPVVLLRFSATCFGVSFGDFSSYVCTYYFQFG